MTHLGVEDRLDHDERDDPRATDRQAPAVSLGPWLPALLASASLVLVAASWLAPLLPTDRGRVWERVQEALGVEAARSVPAWWTSTLLVLTAVAVVAAAALARSHRRRTRVVAWAVTALALGWMSLDHAVAAHRHLGGLTRGVLPEPAGSHPVEVALAVLLVPAGLVLLAGGHPVQRLLLVAAPVVYLSGTAVSAGLVELPVSAHRTAVTEALLEWLGIILLAAAAVVERPPRRATPR